MYDIVDTISRIKDDKDIDKMLSVALHNKKEKAIGNIIAVIRQTEALAECTPMSITAGIIEPTALDLSITNGEYYLIPYRDNKRGIVNAQGQIGYKGLIQLVLRTNKIKTLFVSDYRQGETLKDVKARNILEDDFTFDDSWKGKPVIGYVAYLEDKSGFKKYEYKTLSEIHAHHSKYSKSFDRNSKKFRTNAIDIETMNKKVVLKKLLNMWATKSSEVERAIVNDQKIYDENGHSDYEKNDNTDQNKPLINDKPSLDKINYVVKGHLIYLIQNKLVSEILNKDTAPTLLKTTLEELGFENKNKADFTNDDLRLIALKYEDLFKVPVIYNGEKIVNETPDIEKEFDAGFDI